MTVDCYQLDFVEWLYADLGQENRRCLKAISATLTLYAIVVLGMLMQIIKNKK
jgi:hypothetical protein